MKVVLNGNTYQLSQGTVVRRTPLVEWPDNIRLDGYQKRKDRALISAWSIDRWSGGLGIERINEDVADQIYRLWDVENCDTRYPGQILLAPAFNTATIVPSRGDLNLHLSFQEQLYFIETAHGTTAAGNQFEPARAYQFTPPFILGSYLKVATQANLTAGSISMIYYHSDSDKILFSAHKTIAVGGGIGTVSYLFSTPTLGGPVTTISLLGEGSRPEGLYPQIANIGGTLHVLSKFGRVANLTIINRLLTSLSHVLSYSQSIGSYLSPLVTDGVKVYAQMPDGIYNFDATPDKVIDTSRSIELNGAMVMFENNLYFKNRFATLFYDGVDIKAEGYDTEDGLPSDKWGEVTCFASTWKNIFAAVKGATYSHILSRESNGAWQYYARVPSPGLWVREMFLSSEPDAIDRLWCIFGNYGYPGYFLNPMVNPVQAGTYSYVPTGHFTLPIYGGNMPEQLGAFFDLTVAGRLGGSNIITCLYGLEEAAPNTTLGVVASNMTSLIFGSPYGVQGYQIQPRFMLAGSSGAGTAPVFRQAVIGFLKDPNKRYIYEFDIDLNQTANGEARSREAVIGSLNYEINRKILMPFWYGQIATTTVKVVNAPYAERTPEGRGIFEGEREGIVRLRVANIL